MESYHCPICGSSDCNDFLKIDFLEAGKLLTNNVEKRFSISNLVKSIWGKEYALFVKCNTCQFAFSQPFIAGNDKYYSLVYDNEVSYPANKWEYEKTKKILLKDKNKENLNLLEIGAGDGAFLTKISPDIIKKENIISTEFSKNGLEKITEKGFECFQVSIDELTEKQGIKKIDIACMFQVVEHIDNIHHFFTTLNNLLNPNAKIFIAIPNAIQRDYYDSQGIHYDIPPTHIGRYSKETIEYVCNKYGWKLIDYEHEPMSYKTKVTKFYSERYVKSRFAEKIKNIRPKFLRSLLRYSIVLGIFIKYLKVFIKLRSTKLGTSSWYYIEKSN